MDKKDFLKNVTFSTFIAMYTQEALFNQTIQQLWRN